MASDDELPRRLLVTYGRSHRRDDEETVPDSEDSTSRVEPRPSEDGDGGNLSKQPIKHNGDESAPPRPPRAVYKSQKRPLSPPPLSYTNVASAEEVIPDSEENGRSLGPSSDDEDSDDIRNFSASNTLKTITSGWKQKLRDIDTEFDMDDCPSGPNVMSSPVPDPKESPPGDTFGSPLTTHASSQRASHRSRTDESPSSPSHNASSSTNTTPQFVIGTPQAPSPTPPTSDGKPSPIPKTKTKARGKTRAHSEVQEANIDDQLVPSPEGVRQTRRKEKQKKSKVRIPFLIGVGDGG